MPKSLQVNLKRTWLIVVRFVFLLVVVVNLILGILMDIGNRPLSSDPDAPSKVIRVSQGMNARQIIQLLDEEEIIANPSLFRFVLTVQGADQSLQAGTYRLSPQMTPLEIIERLRLGRVYAIPVVIPEGFEIKQIAAVLADKGLADAQRFAALASDFRFVFGDNPIELPISSLKDTCILIHISFHEGRVRKISLSKWWIVMSQSLQRNNPLLVDSPFSCTR